MIGWFDATFGVSGDMLLAALIGAGADAEAIGAAVAAVAPEPVSVTTERVSRSGLSALRAHVTVAESVVDRTLTDIIGLIGRARLGRGVARNAVAVFERLAEAEARVHGIGRDDVHFHEIGGLDTIADVVGACAGLASLDLVSVSSSPVAVGSGTVGTQHGLLGVPVPAVAELLRGVPSLAGPALTEACTPTGAALLTHFCDTWQAQPAMTVTAIGYGAGAADFTTHPNVLRLLVGEAGASGAGGESASTSVVYEANIDDLDPRLWPTVLTRLLDAGAADAWLTPILMKKGRPAYQLSVLTGPDRASAVRGVIVAETSTIGMRSRPVDKIELARRIATVMVEGEPISVKLALDADHVVNVQPEYDDVARAAEHLHRPVKSVLAAAIAAAATHWEAS